MRTTPDGRRFKPAAEARSLNLLSAGDFIHVFIYICIQDNIKEFGDEIDIAHVYVCRGETNL